LLFNQAARSFEGVHLTPYVNKDKFASMSPSTQSNAMVKSRSDTQISNSLSLPLVITDGEIC